LDVCGSLNHWLTGLMHPVQVCVIIISQEGARVPGARTWGGPKKTECDEKCMHARWPPLRRALRRLRGRATCMHSAADQSTDRSNSSIEDGCLQNPVVVRWRGPPLAKTHYNNNGVGRVVKPSLSPRPFPSWPGLCRIARICRARPRMHTTKQFRPPPLERGRSKGGAVVGAPVHTRHARHDIRQQGMMQHYSRRRAVETSRRDASLGSRLSCWPRPRLPFCGRNSAARASSSTTAQQQMKRKEEVKWEAQASKQAKQSISWGGTTVS